MHFLRQRMFQQDRQRVAKTRRARKTQVEQQDTLLSSTGRSLAGRTESSAGSSEQGWARPWAGGWEQARDADWELPWAEKKAPWRAAQRASTKDCSSVVT